MNDDGYCMLYIALLVGCTPERARAIYKTMNIHARWMTKEIRDEITYYRKKKKYSNAKIGEMFFTAGYNISKIVRGVNRK